MVLTIKSKINNVNMGLVELLKITMKATHHKLQPKIKSRTSFQEVLSFRSA